MSAPGWLSAAVESGLNRYMTLDPQAMSALAQLEGKVIALEVTGLDLELYFLPGADGVQVLGRYEGEADTRLRGTPLSLARLGVQRGVDTGAFGGEIEISGDTETGQRFKEALDRVELDWEEWLSRVTGD
ncbi:MAG: SCP2 sterol-binding domain-containing protein, partial [Gammaproteobacteria bacterium]